MTHHHTVGSRPRLTTDAPNGAEKNQSLFTFFLRKVIRNALRRFDGAKLHLFSKLAKFFLPSAQGKRIKFNN
jgi:hypothetical protein